MERQVFVGLDCESGPTMLFACSAVLWKGATTVEGEASGESSGWAWREKGDLLRRKTSDERCLRDCFEQIDAHQNLEPPSAQRSAA